MIDGANTQAEFNTESKILVMDALVFFELVDDGLHILVEQVFHTVAHELLSLLLAVWQTSQSNHLALVNVQSSSQNLHKVIRRSPYQIKMFFPMDQIPLHDLRLTEHCHIKAKVLANRSVEIPFWPKFRRDQIVLCTVKSLNLILRHPVAAVFLRVESRLTVFIFGLPECLDLLLIQLRKSAACWLP